MYTIIGDSSLRNIRTFGGFFFPDEEKQSEISGDSIGLEMGFSIHVVSKDCSITLEDYNESKLSRLSSHRKIEDRKDLIEKSIDSYVDLMREMRESIIRGDDSYIVNYRDMESMRKASDASYVDSLFVIGQDEPEYVVVFDGVAVSLESIVSEGFDFRGELEKRKNPVESLDCAKCDMYGVKYMISEGGCVGLCPHCAEYIALKCAEIGGNKKIKSDIIASSL